MNKLLLLALASTMSTTALATGCTVVNGGADSGPGDSPDTGTTSGGDAGTDTSGGGGSDSTTTDTGGGGGSDSTTTDTGGGGGSDSTTTSETGGGGLATSCSTGTLYAGNPSYVGEYTDRPTSGTGIHADPPLQWGNLVFAGSRIYTRDDGEVWTVDTSAAGPVETKVAGQNSAKLAYAPGACGAARLAKIWGMAALPDKSIVVADIFGNAVLHIANPTTSACTVEVWAGNATANPDLSDTLNPGDVLGAGASAKFDGPASLVTDDAGNIFVFDIGNMKIKKIAADAAHTVTTVAKIPADGPAQITNLTRIGTKLYAVGTDGAEAYVIAIDTVSGAVSTVIKGGGGKFPPIDASQYPAIAGITTDGTGLILSGKGFIWYLTTSGTLTHIAGAGSPIDFPPSGYDAKASHPAKDVVLGNKFVGSISGSTDYITYHEGSVFWRGRGDGTAAYLEKFSCP